jgi:hypothetical protein
MASEAEVQLMRSTLPYMGSAAAAGNPTMGQSTAKKHAGKTVLTGISGSTCVRKDDSALTFLK